MEPTTKTELLHYEDLNVGDFWVSEWREISGDDVADFAELTGDHDPLHTDQAVDSPFGQPVAHGLLGLSVLAGLSTNYPKAATLAFTSVTDWEFKAPIFFGDKVQVRTEVEQLEPHGRRACRVVWFRKLLNEDGRVLQQGRFISLVAARTRNKRKAKPELDPATPSKAK